MSDNGSWRRSTTNLVVSIALPITLLLLWQIAVSSGWWPRTLIAAPSDVVAGLWNITRSGELFAHTKVSMIRLFAGFTVGSVLGIGLGALVGTFNFSRRLIGPTIESLIPIPPPAWIPILIITLGIGEASKVGLIAIGAFAVVYAATAQGIRGADKRLVEVGQLYEKRRGEMILRILLPSAAPNIFTGLRVALGLSWILLVASEMVAAKMVSAEARLEGIGLGWLIFDARRFGRPEEMIVGMAAMGVLGKLSDMAMAALQSRALRWRTSFTGM